MDKKIILHITLSSNHHKKEEEEEEKSSTERDRASSTVRRRGKGGERIGSVRVREKEPGTPNIQACSHNTVKNRCFHSAHCNHTKANCNKIEIS